MIVVVLLHVAAVLVQLVKADDAAPALGISRSTLLAHAADGKVPHYRIGHAVRFDVEELLAWARRNGNGREPPRNGATPRGGGVAVEREERTTGGRPHG